MTGYEVSSPSRGLVLAKDILVGTTLASAVGAAVAGRKLSAEREGGAVPMNSEGEASRSAPGRARGLGRLTDTFGMLNLLAGMGVITVTTMLSMAAGKSARWAAVSRFLP